MIKKLLSSVAKIKIEGLNIDRLFRTLRRKNIEIKDINRTSYKEIYFIVNYHQVKNLFECLSDSCYTVSIEKYYGIPYILNFLKQKLGILIGTILLTILIVISSNFIWGIEVYGTENLSKQEVVLALNEAGINIGTSFNVNKVESVENYIQQKLDSVSMVSIIKKGSSILVNIKEVRVPKIMSTVNSTSHLVAGYDGVITKINSIQGTPLVKVGDVVKEGDTLIAGYFYSIDGIKTDCIAIGEVYANIWYSHTVEFNTSQTQLLRTGNEVSDANLKLFGKKFEIKKANNTFENFEVEQKEEYLFKNNLVPLKIYKTIYYETTPILVEKSFEENRQQLLDEAILLANEKMPEYLVGTKEFTTIEKNENTYLISAFIEAEVKIDEVLN